jgi:uncharacterized metal-binding protein
MKPKLPPVYACSGASSAAQMANHMAVRLGRLKVAEMSCLAGVGGDVPPLVRTANSGRPIIALDGCPLHCAARILQRHHLRATKHYDLSALDVKKRMHEDFDLAEAARVLQRLLADLRPSPPADETAPVLSPPSEEELRESASPPCSRAEFQSAGPNPRPP